MKHGVGEFKFSNGNVYEGEFKADRINGQGRYTYSEGHVYEGNWKDGDIRGRCIHANVDIYEGKWKDGRMHGKAKRYWPMVQCTKENLKTIKNMDTEG
jgi:hypothetical protein